ncbi:hypothetical protein RB597_003187 [Gaeumannomyces tritici]
MKFSSFVTLVLPTLAFAAPVNQTFILEPGKYHLAHNGEVLSLTETELVEFLKAQNISRYPPPIDEDWLKWTPPANETKSALAARGQCDSTTAFIVDKQQRFTDWDVQMSSILFGGRNGADLTVSEGWTVTNTVGVSAGLSPTFIKAVLGGTFNINYSKSWATSTTTTYKTTVKPGEVGVFAVMPWVTRRYGRVFRGCPGAYTQTGTFMADSHEDSVPNEMRNWVHGPVFPCIKDEPKGGQGFTRCHGSGEFN